MNVLLLPHNIASDISHKVRALNSIGINAQGLALPSSQIQTMTDVKMLANYTKNPFANRLRGLQNLRSIYQAIRRADIIHWTYSLGVLPLGLDEKILSFFNKPGVVQWYGSDIRNPKIESEINPFYREVFRDEDYEYKDESASASLKNQQRFARLGFFPLEFPEMSHYIRADLFPVRFQTRQMVVLADHEPEFPNPQTRKPLIVHSPSAPVAKGTKYVLAAIEYLKSKYDFEFVLVENLARAEALKIMRRCDIFIDQLIIGSHGYAAIEAMAFGKPVVCYINEKIKEKYPPDLPIVNANPETITEKLELLIKNGERRNELGKKGRSYVEKYHGDRKIAEDLAETYRQIIQMRDERRKESDG